MIDHRQSQLTSLDPCASPHSPGDVLFRFPARNAQKRSFAQHDYPLERCHAFPSQNPSPHWASVEHHPSVHRLIFGAPEHPRQGTHVLIRHVRGEERTRFVRRTARALLRTDPTLSPSVNTMLGDCCQIMINASQFQELQLRIPRHVARDCGVGGSASEGLEFPTALRGVDSTSWD